MKYINFDIILSCCFFYALKCEIEKHDGDATLKSDTLKEIKSLQLPAISNANTRVYSLFVNDCLSNYTIDKYLVKYRYHNYGGNYKQLPNFIEKK